MCSCANVQPWTAFSIFHTLLMFEYILTNKQNLWFPFLLVPFSNMRPCANTRQVNQWPCFLLMSIMTQALKKQQFPLKELHHHSCILKKFAKLFKIVISNSFQSLLSSAILASFCSRITL